jgi:hypothetical protein
VQAISAPSEGYGLAASGGHGQYQTTVIASVSEPDYRDMLLLLCEQCCEVGVGGSIAPWLCLGIPGIVLVH